MAYVYETYYKGTPKELERAGITGPELAERRHVVDRLGLEAVENAEREADQLGASAVWMLETNFAWYIVKRAVHA